MVVNPDRRPTPDTLLCVGAKLTAIFLYLLHEPFTGLPALPGAL